MATGYPDYQRLTFIAEKAAILYYERVFLEVITDLVITNLKLIPNDSTMFVHTSLTVSGSGKLFIDGELHLL